MSPHSPFFSRRRPRSFGWRFWMVWVLCLCAWRGPVPVLHCHALEVQDPACAWHLAEHIALCHRGEVDHSPCDWHVHFIVPGCAGHGQSEPESPLDPSDSSAALENLITHDGHSSKIEPPLSHKIANDSTILTAPAQPALSPNAPKLIPLAPPRARPSRVSPRIYYCVAQC